MTSMSNEPTPTPTPTTGTNVENTIAHVDNEQVPSQVIKVEPDTTTSTHALSTPIQELKVEEQEDTPMIDAENIENNTNTNTNTNSNETQQDTTILLKMEEILSKEVNKDDTLVKPPPSPTSNSELPTTQPQSILTQPDTNNIEQPPSTLNTDTAVPNPETPIPVTAAPTPITTFEEIQKQLKNTLDHVEQRNMVSGFQTLSKATGAVVDHCEQLGIKSDNAYEGGDQCFLLIQSLLGLTSDDHPYNAIDREQFWAGLNNCWLYALAQRHEPSSDAERLTDQHLYSLRELVVTWADKLERFGLVDYEMGWWEADILAAIDGILAMNYAAAQAAAQAVVAQAAAALFGEEVNMQ